MHGRLIRVEPRDSEGLGGSVYLPASTPKGRATFVSIHGVSRRSEEHVERWVPLAERLGLTLVVPEFTRRTFPGYQTLRAADGHFGADSAFLQWLDRLRDSGLINQGPVFLFGFSGGAQFVHRFMLTHPYAADAAAVTSAGWYTFPDPRLIFPFGLGMPRGSLERNLPGFLSKPLLVAVGEDDRTRDHQLRCQRIVDERQGRNRVERAERWVDALRAKAAELGMPDRVVLTHLPSVGHQFEACMRAGLSWVVGDSLSDWLSPQAALGTGHIGLQRQSLPLPNEA